MPSNWLVLIRTYRYRFMDACIFSTSSKVPPKQEAPPPPTVADEDPAVRRDKEIRKMRKKIRECDAILEKKS